MRNAKLLLLTAILASIPGFAQMDPPVSGRPSLTRIFWSVFPGRTSATISDCRSTMRRGCAAIAGTRPCSRCPRISAARIRPITPGAGPANLRIWKEVDRDTQKLIAYHTHISWQAPERTIWMDGRPHPPADAAHTWQGFSTGKWDGDVLTITTTHLKEGWIRRNGIPRSENATITEHLFRHGDRLTVMVIVNDPEYLTEPFVRTTDFLYDARQEIAPYPCEAVVEVPRPRGTVPNHLPGDNAFLTEFANRAEAPVRSHARRRRNHVSRISADHESGWQHGRRGISGRNRRPACRRAERDPCKLPLTMAKSTRSTCRAMCTC